MLKNIFALAIVVVFGPLFSENNARADDLPAGKQHPLNNISLDITNESGVTADELLHSVSNVFGILDSFAANVKNGSHVKINKNKVKVDDQHIDLPFNYSTGIPFVNPAEDASGTLRLSSIPAKCPPDETGKTLTLTPDLPLTNISVSVLQVCTKNIPQGVHVDIIPYLVEGPKWQDAAVTASNEIYSTLGLDIQANAISYATVSSPASNVSELDSSSSYSGSSNSSAAEVGSSSEVPTTP